MRGSAAALEAFLEFRRRRLEFLALDQQRFDASFELFVLRLGLARLLRQRGDATVAKFGIRGRGANGGRERRARERVRARARVLRRRRAAAAGPPARSSASTCAATRSESFIRYASFSRCVLVATR